MATDVFKGHVNLLVLASVTRGSAHGYAICEELKRRSGDVFDLPEGTVYPALHRLEASGLLDSGWATVDGRRRRVYQVTRKGRRALGEQSADWRRFAAAMRSVLEVTPWPSPS